MYNSEVFLSPEMWASVRRSFDFFRLTLLDEGGPHMSSSELSRRRAVDPEWISASRAMQDEDWDNFFEAAYATYALWAVHNNRVDILEAMSAPEQVVALARQIAVEASELDA